MLVFIAVGLAALLGMVGLGVDIGFLTMQQRVLKNATDSAAIAGALELVHAENMVQPQVTALAGKHDLPVGTTVSCAYVNSANTVVQSSCAAGAPNGTAGIKVGAVYPMATFFMGILGSPTTTARTESIARPYVELSYNANASLFAACGWDTKLASGGTMSLLSGTAPGSAPWPVNPAAIGQTFVLHGAQVATCGYGSNSFKGLLASSTLVTLPTNLPVENGNQAGPTRAAVNGKNGCGAGIDPNNCVMLVPIATQWPGGNFLTAVRWLPFLVTTAGANTHHGRLLGSDYVIVHDPNSLTGAWIKGGTGGPVSIRLAE